jgi:hypothetical protein
MTVAAMLSREGRRRGVRDNDDGEEEVLEVDDSDETVAASRGGGRRKGGFEESLRRTARPTAPTGRMGAVTTKSTKTCRPPATTRTTWRCCPGGGWTPATPTPTAPTRWRGVW